MIKRDEQTKEYIGIACNLCKADAPPAKEIMAAHGLNRMGWYCSGGTHLCPDCWEKPE
jgi:hypothetical protein